MNYTPSPHCKKNYRQHPRYELLPRSDSGSNVGVCRICKGKKEYPPVTFDGVFHTSLESNPLISHWVGYDR